MDKKGAFNDKKRTCPCQSVKGGFKLSFYGGLKMYDLGGLRTDRC